MKKIYDDDDDNGFQDIDKAKILVTVIPFVLIIIILAITLLVNSCNNQKPEQGNEQLQESIKDYADDKLPEQGNPVVAATPFTEDTDIKEEQPVDTETSEATPTPHKEAMETSKDYSKIAFEKEAHLKEMSAYWADNNQKAIDDLANLDHFKAMSWSLKGTENFYYYGDVNGSGQPHGTGIAVYADNQYYYGGWENGVRSGNGTWIHYHIHEKPSTTDLYTYHQYTGSWKNDLPNGEGSEHYDYNTELLKENTGYNTNIIGSYTDGLIDGEFYLTNIYSDENIKEWYADAVKGSWVVIGNTPDKEGRYPVYVEDRNDENYIWMHPDDNKNIGVPCIISMNKN